MSEKPLVKKQRFEKPKAPSASGRSGKYAERYELLGQLSFVHKEALNPDALDFFSGARETIKTKVVLGKNATHPLVLEKPIIIADMSFGALSETTKLVLAKGSTMAGIAHSTGEGGILPGEKELAKLLVVQYSTGRFGWPEREEKWQNWLKSFRDAKMGWAKIMKTADPKEVAEFTAACMEYASGCSAICFKFGQGAKPGQGGLLEKSKVTKRIAEVRKIKEGENCHSPASHWDIHNFEDLKAKITWLKKVSAGAPVIIKFGAGYIKKDIRLAVEAGADIIEVDGAEGGTGASPSVMLDEVGVPTLPALVMATKVYKELYEEGYRPAGGEKNLPEFVIGGGIKTGADVVKCLALGADAVMVGIGFMTAIGCTECGLCYTGKCPRGIATQDPELEKKLKDDFEGAVERVANYAISMLEEAKMLAAVCGKDDISKLDRTNMFCEVTPLGKIVSEMTDVVMAYDIDDECVDNSTPWKK